MHTLGVSLSTVLTCETGSPSVIFSRILKRSGVGYIYDARRTMNGGPIDRTIRLTHQQWDVNSLHTSDLS